MQLESNCTALIKQSVPGRLGGCQFLYYWWVQHLELGGCQFLCYWWVQHLESTMPYAETMVCLMAASLSVGHATIVLALMCMDKLTVIRTDKFKLMTMYDNQFLHDWPWVSPWIKSICNELDITCHVFLSQLSGHCDIIANRLWRYLQNVKQASDTRGCCVKILVLASFMESLCRVRKK